MDFTVNIENQMKSMKKGILILVFLLAILLPIGQLIIGVEYYSSDKTRATLFLCSNSMMYFIVILAVLCNAKKNYKCCYKMLQYVWVVPIIIVQLIGLTLYYDYGYWKIAYEKSDYKYAPEFVFLLAYILNIFNYLIFTTYGFITIIRYFGLGCTNKPEENKPWFFCGEVLCGE